MVKGSFASDTFEKLAEFGQSTAKKTVKSVAQTFNPIKILESANSSTSENGEEEALKNYEQNKGKGITPLNFDKLQGKYKDQDKVKQEALRLKLFRLVKSGEERVVEAEKRDQEEKKQKEAYEQRQKKQQEQQKKQQEQEADIPKGKVRKSIFSAKKVAERQQIEVKANSGKQ